MKSTSTPPPEPWTSTARWALAGLALSMLLSSLGISSAHVALPSLALTFSASLPQVQWVVLAYLLSLTTLSTLAGRLGDLLGQRLLLLVGLGVFSLASLGCALAPSLPLLIAARVVQGLGAALMMALTLALVGTSVPPSRTGSAMGLLGTLSGLGTALGPSLGGWLLARWGWPAVFALNVPLGLLALSWAGRCLPLSTAPTAGGRGLRDLDLPGVLLLMLTLLAYALALTGGNVGLSLPLWPLLALVVLGAVLFIRVEARAHTPLVQLALLHQSGLGQGLVANALVSTVMMSTLVVGPFYLAYGLGLDAAQVGLVMAAGPLAAALTGWPAGRCADRWGAPLVLRLGLGGMAVGCGLLAALAGSAIGYLVPLVVLTSSYALFHTANNSAVLSAIAPQHRGVSSGLLSLSRNLGLLTGASVMSTLFAWAVGDPHVRQASTEALQNGMQISYVCAVALVLLALAVRRD